MSDGPARPNVVLITSHDLGRHLGCYGVRTVRSPAIDSIAAAGVMLSSAFCTAPQCSPSRASIATGRYPQSNGVMGLCHAQFAWDLNDDEVHLAERLQQVGYHTALSGVYHESRDPRRAKFDAHLKQNGDSATLRRLILDGPETPAMRVAAQAVDYIESRSSPADPYYLQVGFFEPHRTRDGSGYSAEAGARVTVPGYLVDDESGRGDLAEFEAAIAGLDRGVAAILNALETTGQRDDTLVIFTADHGIPFPRAKCSLYDPGLEVAMMAHWPAGGVTGGGRIDSLVSNIDLTPTILELVGAPIPDNIQGRSFAPALRGQPCQPRAEIFGQMTYHQYADPMRCIRTETHKLIVFFSNAPALMDPSQSWRPRSITTVPPDPAFAYHPPLELYDLTRDPLEQNNLADDPALSTTRRELLTRLHRWMRETSDPLLQGLPVDSMYHRAINALQSAGD